MDKMGEAALFYIVYIDVAGVGAKFDLTYLNSCAPDVPQYAPQNRNNRRHNHYRRSPEVEQTFGVPSASAELNHAVSTISSGP